MDAHIELFTIFAANTSGRLDLRRALHHLKEAFGINPGIALFGAKWLDPQIANADPAFFRRMFGAAIDRLSAEPSRVMFIFLEAVQFHRDLNAFTPIEGAIIDSVAKAHSGKSPGIDGEGYRLKVFGDLIRREGLDLYLRVSNKVTIVFRDVGIYVGREIEKSNKSYRLVDVNSGLGFVTINELSFGEVSIRFAISLRTGQELDLGTGVPIPSRDGKYVFATHYDVTGDQYGDTATIIWRIDRHPMELIFYGQGAHGGYWRDDNTIVLWPNGSGYPSEEKCDLNVDILARIGEDDNWRYYRLGETGENRFEKRYEFAAENPGKDRRKVPRFTDPSPGIHIYSFAP